MYEALLRAFDRYMVKHISFALNDEDHAEIKSTKRERESWEDWALRAADALENADE